MLYYSVSSVYGRLWQHLLITWLIQYHWDITAVCPALNKIKNNVILMPGRLIKTSFKFALSFSIIIIIMFAAMIENKKNYY